MPSFLLGVKINFLGLYSIVKLRIKEIFLPLIPLSKWSCVAKKEKHPKQSKRMCAKKLKKNKGKTQMKCQNVVKKKGKEKRRRN